MIVLDPGHTYQLDNLDGHLTNNNIVFVKRQGDGYPGNEGSYPGTTCQDVLRVLIDRVKYLDTQIPCAENKAILDNLRTSLYHFESRAAQRHIRSLPRMDFYAIEEVPACVTCGHIGCECE